MCRIANLFLSQLVNEHQKSFRDRGTLGGKIINT